VHAPLVLTAQPGTDPIDQHLPLPRRQRQLVVEPVVAEVPARLGHREVPDHGPEERDRCDVARGHHRLQLLRNLGGERWFAGLDARPRRPDLTSHEAPAGSGTRRVVTAASAHSFSVPSTATEWSSTDATPIVDPT